MRVGLILLAFAFVIPPPAVAQDSTADGVKALVSGDYAAAVRILRPLAEDRPDADPLAAFFLGMLYHSEVGVRADMIRACGLFFKAATPANPLLPQSLALATSIHKQSGRLRELCSLAGARGWGVPRPVTFTLGPDHSVRIDGQGLFIRLRGTETRPEIGWGGAGWTFLPTRLTEISQPPGSHQRRLFIEFFVWIPHSPVKEPLWSLTWFAHEVVGAKVVTVPGDGTIATASGGEPPSSFPVDDMARIVLAEDGEVSRIVTGPHARAVAVPVQEVR